MDHLWIYGAPVLGALLLTGSVFGAVSPFRGSRAGKDDNDVELALVSQSGRDSVVPIEQEPADQMLCADVLDLQEPAAVIESERFDVAEPAIAPDETIPPSAAEFSALVLEPDAPSIDTVELHRILSVGRERHEQHREIERTTAWYLRLDPDLESPTVIERMALASWLAIPAPFAGKFLRAAFAEEDSPRVRARIIGALAGGDHFEDARPFEIAFQNGGVERAAVWETLAPRRSEVSWAGQLLDQKGA